MDRRLLGVGYHLTAFGCIAVLLAGIAVPEVLAVIVGDAGADSLVLGALVGLVCLYGLVDDVDGVVDRTATADLSAAATVTESDAEGTPDDGSDPGVTNAGE